MTATVPRNAKNDSPRLRMPSPEIDCSPGISYSNGDPTFSRCQRDHIPHTPPVISAQIKVRVVDPRVARRHPSPLDAKGS